MTSLPLAVRCDEGAPVVPAERADWYYMNRALWPHLRGAPGARRERNGALVIHRSHLPLLPPWAIGSLLASPAEAGAQTAVGVFSGDTKLREYQYAGVDFIRRHRGTLLGWQQRLGKTPTIVASHDLVRDGQLLVVAPLSARGVWLHWFHHRWPGVKPVVVVGRRFDVRSLRRAPLILVHYDVALSAQTFDFTRLGMVVFDEAHVLSNARSQRFQAACIFATQAARVVLATGTPIWNRPAELYQLLTLIAPGAWGTWREWIMRYCAGRRTAYGVQPTGVSHEEELQQRLTEIASTLLWSEVLAMKDIGVVHQVRLAPVTPTAERELVELAEKVHVHGRRRSMIGEIARMRRILGVAKWMSAVDCALRILETERAVVVWAWHQDLAERVAGAIRKSGRTCCLVHGSIDVADRAALLASWRQDGGALVITLAVGQTAIDLSAARHCVFAEQDWTPAVLSQAEMRTFAPERPMFVVHVVADHWIDVRITSALAKKVDLASQVGLPAAETAVDMLYAALCGDQELSDDFRGLLSACRVGSEIEADTEYKSDDYFG